MSKTKTVNKKTVDPQHDKNKDKLVEPNNKKKKELKYEDSDEDTNDVDIGVEVFKKEEVKEEKKEEVLKKRKQTKNEMYKDDQNRFFEHVKTNVLCVGNSNSFTSKYLDNGNSKIIKELLEGMKKYYHNEMYKGISGTDNKTSLSLIKKLCDYHGFDVVKKEIKTEVDRWYIYYIVLKHKEPEDENSA